MLEMGVALTWGVRVLPIKAEGRPTPPSDVSSQTWADYQDSANVFLDSHRQDKLMAMIERALRKKGRQHRVAADERRTRGRAPPRATSSEWPLAAERGR